MSGDLDKLMPRVPDERFVAWMREHIIDFRYHTAGYAVVLDITDSPIWDHDDPDADEYGLNFTEEGHDWIAENLPPVEGKRTVQFEACEWGAYAGFGDPDQALLFKMRWL